MPAEPPTALTEAFAADHDQVVRWQAFGRRLAITAPPSWADVLALLRLFLLPPYAAVAAGQSFARTWPPGGPWN